MDDLDGFRQFVDERGSALSRTAFLLTGDHATAEDLVQEVLIKTASHWRRVAASGDPYPWVRRVMLNELRRWWRPRRVRTVSGVTLPDHAVDSPSGRTETKLMLQRALRVLSPMQRAVLFLRYYDDLTEVDCAAALGCSVGTVKRHAHDALRRLRTVAPELLDSDHRQVTHDADSEPQLPRS